MQEVTKTLERNAQEVKFGSVSVELRIHEGKVVKTIYRTATTNVTRKQSPEKIKEENYGGS
jgi:hypothetical protein